MIHKKKSVLYLAGLPVSSFLLGYVVDGLSGKTWHLVVMVFNSKMVLYTKSENMYAYSV